MKNANTERINAILAGLSDKQVEYVRYLLEALFCNEKEENENG